MSEFRHRVVELCTAELERWEGGSGRDHETPYSHYVGDYWSVGLNKKWDGQTTFVDEKGRRFRPPWSAAFIAYIFRCAGAGDTFCYHEAHIHYIAKAIADAKEADECASFFGRDPETYAPKPGDIIAAARGPALRYSEVLKVYGPELVPRGRFIPAHADIVVAVESSQLTLRTVGGNLGRGTVGERHWRLSDQGRLADSSDLTCIIECTL